MSDIITIIEHNFLLEEVREIKWMTIVLTLFLGMFMGIAITHTAMTYQNEYGETAYLPKVKDANESIYK